MLRTGIPRHNFLRNLSHLGNSVTSSCKPHKIATLITQNECLVPLVHRVPRVP